MHTDDLSTLYSAKNAQTLAVWDKNPRCGETRSAPWYDPHLLALAAGIRPAMTDDVRVLLDDLQRLTRNDALADVMPKRAWHFTFLPVTLPLYQPRQPLPEKTAELQRIWTAYQGEWINIRQLRLVALPGQLLLAGIADDAAIARRQRFCAQVLASSWQEELSLRHAATPLPAPFWHSTLLRYDAQYLPDYLRAFFRERQACRYGDASGALLLARISYNWEQVEPLDGLPT